MLNLSNILLWIAVALIAGGILNLLVRMFIALINDEEWGLLTAITGLIIGAIAVVLHQMVIANLGR